MFELPMQQVDGPEQPVFTAKTASPVTLTLQSSISCTPYNSSIQTLMPLAANSSANFRAKALSFEL